MVFVTLEDKAGITNRNAWLQVLEEHRNAELGSRLVLVNGQLQSEAGVIHVVMREADDLNAWLGQLETISTDFH